MQPKCSNDSMSRFWGWKRTNFSYDIMCNAYTCSAYIHMHPCNTYTHMYMHTYIHTYVHTRVHIYIHIYNCNLLFCVNTGTL